MLLAKNYGTAYTEPVASAGMKPRMFGLLNLRG